MSKTIAPKCIFCGNRELELADVWVSINKKDDVPCKAIVCNDCGAIYPGIPYSLIKGKHLHKIAEMALSKMKALQ